VIDQTVLLTDLYGLAVEVLGLSLFAETCKASNSTSSFRLFIRLMFALLLLS